MDSSTRRAVKRKNLVRRLRDPLRFFVFSQRRGHHFLKIANSPVIGRVRGKKRRWLRSTFRSFLHPLPKSDRFARIVSGTGCIEQTDPICFGFGTARVGKFNSKG